MPWLPNLFTILSKIMDSFASFLDCLFSQGAVRFRASCRCPILRRLSTYSKSAYTAYALDVAGPAVPFDPPTALAAAKVVQQACWFLVCRDEPDEAIDKGLALPGPPSSAAQHLSADLTLCYLSQIHRRAFALGPEDRLTNRLAVELLRQWPLSGVLSTVLEHAEGDLEFGGHKGLLLLYAERLLVNEKPAWIPSGRGLEYFLNGSHGKEDGHA